MEDVPHIHRSKWAWAWAVSEVIKRVLEATTDIALERALKWFLFLPKALLRETRRGGKKGQSSMHMARRFDCLVQRDWKTLLALLHSDEEFNNRKVTARRNSRNGQTVENAERKREVKDTEDQVSCKTQAVPNINQKRTMC